MKMLFQYESATNLLIVAEKYVMIMAMMICLEDREICDDNGDDDMLEDRVNAGWAPPTWLKRFSLSMACISGAMTPSPYDVTN